MFFAFAVNEILEGCMEPCFSCLEIKKYAEYAEGGIWKSA